jgi:hypothetical protein
MNAELSPVLGRSAGNLGARMAAMLQPQFRTTVCRDVAHVLTRW